MWGLLQAGGICTAPVPTPLTSCAAQGHGDLLHAPLGGRGRQKHSEMDSRLDTDKAAQDFGRQQVLRFLSISVLLRPRVFSINKGGMPEKQF